MNDANFDTTVRSVSLTSYLGDLSEPTVVAVALPSHGDASFQIPIADKVRSLLPITARSKTLSVSLLPEISDEDWVPVESNHLLTLSRSIVVSCGGLVLSRPKISADQHPRKKTLIITLYDDAKVTDILLESRKDHTDVWHRVEMDADVSSKTLSPIHLRVNVAMSRNFSGDPEKSYRLRINGQSRGRKAIHCDVPVYLAVPPNVHP